MSGSMVRCRRMYRWRQNPRLRFSARDVYSRRPSVHLQPDCLRASPVLEVGAFPCIVGVIVVFVIRSHCTAPRVSILLMEYEITVCGCARAFYVHLSVCVCVCVVCFSIGSVTPVLLTPVRLLYEHSTTHLDGHRHQGQGTTLLSSSEDFRVSFCLDIFCNR